MIERGTSPFSGIVFKLILANVFVYIIQMLTENSIIYYFGLIPIMVTEKLYIWQLFSYMFLHAPTTVFHIFFNMYALLIFGVSIEQAWGSRRFLYYYLFCGIGAGITIYLINLITGGAGYYHPTIGASGAVFGLLLAFGVLYPNTELLLFFILPIKAKYLVIMYGLVELYLELFGRQSNISHLGHLGGLLFGIIYFLIFRKRALSFKGKLLRSKIRKSIDEIDSQVQKREDEFTGTSITRMTDILKKLRETGPDSITDDEFQYIKYIEIMTEDDDDFSCPEKDFNIDEGFCNSCENLNACFIRQVNKYF